MAGRDAPAPAQVAQLVEQRTENPRVGGSNPPLGTIFFLEFEIWFPLIAGRLKLPIGVIFGHVIIIGQINGLVAAYIFCSRIGASIQQGGDSS